MKSSTVTSSFLALSFDPYAGTGKSPATRGVTGGMARLALLGNDGKEIKVGNLTKPITFTVPAVSGDDGSTSLGCSFWDEAAQEYSSAGCVGAPNPRPLLHGVQWNASLDVTSDALLALAWQITNTSSLNLARSLLSPARPPARRLPPFPGAPALLVVRLW